MTQFVEEFPEFSPDGRWLAYTSDESGRAEVYVRPFQREGSVVQISTQGGRAPAWSHDGAEIVYRQGGSFMSVTVSVNESGLQPLPPQELFAGPYWDSWPMRAYDIAPDGRFLILKEAETANRGAFAAFFPDRVRLVPDWLQRAEEEIDGGR
jgi:serine/threonine-protein kinase